MSLLYVDSSAFVKLYVDEAGSQALRARILRSEEIASSVLLWPETLAMLARRRREALLTAEEHARLRRQFHADYEAVVVVDLDGRVLEITDRLVPEYPLRGADAVHLASALLLAESGLSVAFACSDRILGGAARAHRLEVFDPAAP